MTQQYLIFGPCKNWNDFKIKSFIGHEFNGMELRMLKKIGLAIAVAVTVAASAGAAQAQHWGGHGHGGYYRGGYGPGLGFGFASGLALGSAGGYYGGYAGCERRVFIDRFGYRRVRRVCY